MEMALDGAERLGQWIKRSKVSQVEAAQIIGIDPTQLSQILSRKRRPGLDNAVKIERATGIVVEAWVPLSDDLDVDTAIVGERKQQIGNA